MPIICIRTGLGRAATYALKKDVFVTDDVVAAARAAKVTAGPITHLCCGLESDLLTLEREVRGIRSGVSLLVGTTDQCCELYEAAEVLLVRNIGGLKDDSGTVRTGR